MSDRESLINPDPRAMELLLQLRLHVKAVRSIAATPGRSVPADDEDEAGLDAATNEVFLAWVSALDRWAWGWDQPVMTFEALKELDDSLLPPDLTDAQIEQSCALADAHLVRATLRSFKASGGEVPAVIFDLIAND